MESDYLRGKLVLEKISKDHEELKKIRKTSMTIFYQNKDHEELKNIRKTSLTIFIKTKMVSFSSQLDFFFLPGYKMLVN